MKISLRVVLVAAASTSLFACGGGGHKIGSSPEAAASALYQATQASDESTASTAAAGLTANGEATVKCKLSGQVKLKAGASVGSEAIELERTATFENCVNITYDDPETAAEEKDHVVLNGTLTVTNKLAAGFIGQTVKGKVTFGGAFNDFVEADVVQSVEFAKLGAKTGALTIKYNGSISTTEKTHALANANVTINTGKLSAATKAEIEASATK
jgi:hypothetical protein